MKGALFAFYQPPSKWNAGSRLLGTLCWLSAAAFALTEADLHSAGTFATLGAAFLAAGVWFSAKTNRYFLLTGAALLVTWIAYLVITYQET